jgi:hypothetical protein
MTLKVFYLAVLMVSMFLNQAQAKEWEVAKNNHFIVNYRTEVTEQFAQTVLDSSEEIFRQVLENLGLSRYQSLGDKKVTIYVYLDKDDYIKNSGQAGWSHGAAYTFTKTIHTFPADWGFFDTLLPHELGHIVLHDYVGEHGNMPLWFDEGVAIYQEKAKQMLARRTVQEALKNGQFISLNQLTDMRLYSHSPKETVELFYAESASVVYFLISQLGEGYFHRLCRELKEGTPFAEALSKVYPQIPNMDELNKRWTRYVKGD